MFTVLQGRTAGFCGQFKYLFLELKLGGTEIPFQEDSGLQNVEIIRKEEVWSSLE